jgi:REP element-mobilizing transposase RayT
MPRPLRILIPGGYYHVTCRGNDRRAIYRDDQDRSVFLEKLRGSLANYQVELHAYVLMSNHVLCGASHNIRICSSVPMNAGSESG